jgi:CBS domain-containing protein
MTTVAQLLALKGNKVFSTSPSSTVYDAIKTMADENIGALAVVDNGRLVGIFTERDYARKVILRGKASPTTTIREVMSANPICVYPSHTVEQCMALMTQKTFRHLPVLEANRMVGMISIGDLVKSIIQEQEFIIDQLAHYIQGA